MRGDPRTLRLYGGEEDEGLLDGALEGEPERIPLEDGGCEAELETAGEGLRVLWRRMKNGQWSIGLAPCGGDWGWRMPSWALRWSGDETGIVLEIDLPAHTRVRQVRPSS